MTRKDFEAVARILRNTKMPQILWTRLLVQFIELFSDANPRFDWERFKEASQPPHGFPTAARLEADDDNTNGSRHSQTEQSR